MDMKKYGLQEGNETSVLRTVGILHGSGSESLEFVEYMQFALKIFQSMVKEDNISMAVVESHIEYLIQITLLAVKFEWKKVLQFDDVYRTEQYRLGFKWGSELESLIVKFLRHTECTDVDKEVLPNGTNHLDSLFCKIDSSVDGIKQELFDDITDVDNIETESDRNPIGVVVVKSEYESETDMQKDVKCSNDGNEKKSLRKGDSCKHVNSASHVSSEAYVAIPKGTNGRPHNCLICSKTFLKASHLRNHMIIHSGEKPYECEICRKRFNQAQNLNLHKNIHLMKGKYQCHVCDKRYNFKSGLKVHLMSHSGVTPYVCHICDKGFRQKCNLTSHLHTHTEQQTLKETMDDMKIADKDDRIEQNENSEPQIVKTELDHAANFENDNEGLEIFLQENVKIECVPEGSIMQDHMENSLKMYNKDTKQMEDSSKIYVCSQCNACFNHKRGLAMHEKIHNPDKCFTCTECGKKCTSKSKLGKHMIYHGERNIECQLCPKKFFFSRDLKDHMRIHLSEKQHKCPVCEKAFLRAHHLRDHIRIHSGEKPHKCDICGKEFVQARNLATHKNIHSDEFMFKCEVCDKGFNFASGLKAHMAKHSEDIPYICHICSKGFKLKHHLKSHLISHREDRPFHCSYCDKKFKDAKALTSHQETIHMKIKALNHTCEICGYSTTKAYLLEQHKRIHTGETPYECDVCQKSFSQHSSLRRHKLIHSGEKPLKCSLCEESFRDHSTLKKHMYTHTREKPFECGVCNKRFPWSHLLKKHMEMHSIA